MHNLKAFKCSCILIKDSYIDNTFKDELVIESKIINLI